MADTPATPARPAENTPSRSPERPAWLGGEKSNNVWRWTWKTNDGYQETDVSRGPTTHNEMRDAAQLILDGMTRSAVASGADDPGLEIVSIEPAGKDGSPFGAFRPAGAKPMDVQKFDKK